MAKAMVESAVKPSRRMSRSGGYLGNVGQYMMGGLSNPAVRSYMLSGKHGGPDVAEHKFRAFLRSRQWSDNLLDFVDFANPVRDPGLPDPTSWEELETYLVGRKAPPHAIESAKHLWGLYEQDRPTPHPY